MKKAFAIGLILTLLLITADVRAFCCKDPDTRQWKCYSSGCCYSDIWYSDLVNFNAWSASPGPYAYTVGRSVPVAFYIQNMGCSPDRYDLTLNKDFGEYSHLVYVDFPMTETDVIYPGEAQAFYPIVTILATDVPGTIEFVIQSKMDESKNCPNLFECPKIQISGEGLPLSLPEFGFFGLIEIVILSTVIFLIVKGGRR